MENVLKKVIREEIKEYHSAFQEVDSGTSKHTTGGSSREQPSTEKVVKKISKTETRIMNLLGNIGARVASDTITAKKIKKGSNKI